jgi:hypothetical protein
MTKFHDRTHHEWEGTELDDEQKVLIVVYDALENYDPFCRRDNQGIFIECENQVMINIEDGCIFMASAFDNASIHLCDPNSLDKDHILATYKGLRIKGPFGP